MEHILLLSNMLLNGYHSVIVHSLVDGHLGPLEVSAIMKKAANV